MSASVPVSLALVEAIAGRERANALARSMGVDDGSPAHDSDAYGLKARHLLVWLRNKATFWRHDTLGVDVEPGVDEVALALFADAWSRTYRSRVVTVSRSDGPVRTRSGLLLVRDRTSANAKPPSATLDLSGLNAGSALDRPLQGIGAAYGQRTATLVALQLEYPASPSIYRRTASLCPAQSQEQRKALINGGEFIRCYLTKDPDGFVACLSIADDRQERRTV